MSVRRLSFRIRAAYVVAALMLATVFAYGQQQSLPDAPAPQNNAPAPSANIPVPTASDDQSSSSSNANPEQPRNTRPQESTNPEPPPPGSREIKTVPPGSVPPSDNAQDELFRLTKNVSFVSIPVRVKDSEGKLVDGLLAKDFSVYEDGVPQKLTFFTSDAFPLAAALIIDQGLPEPALKKVNQTFAALGGAFGPFDEVAVFTYGNTVNKRQDFGNSTRMALALNRLRDEAGA